jgi:hypothetical protein
MWEPRSLTTLWAFTACYRDSFTFYLYHTTLPQGYPEDGDTRCARNIGNDQNTTIFIVASVKESQIPRERGSSLGPIYQTTRRHIPEDSYSGGAWFESRPGHRLSRLWLLAIFLSPFRQIQGYYSDQDITASFQILSNS